MLIGSSHAENLSGKGGERRQDTAGYPFLPSPGEGFFVYPFMPKNTKGKEKMKKIRMLSLVLALVLALCLFACAEKKEEPENPGQTETVTQAEENKIPNEGVWKDATYREDTEIGKGELEFDLVVKAEEYSVTFKIKTDEQNLGKALLGSKIEEGEDGAFGLYIKKVNGMTADYDVNQTYWSFCIVGEAQMTGVSSVEISGGEEFEWVLAK